MFALWRCCCLLPHCQNWNHLVRMSPCLSGTRHLNWPFLLFLLVQEEMSSLPLSRTRSCSVSIFFTSLWTLLCRYSCLLCYQYLSIGSSYASLPLTIIFSISYLPHLRPLLCPSQPHFWKDLLRYLHFLTSHLCFHSVLLLPLAWCHLLRWRSPVTSTLSDLSPP